MSKQSADRFDTSVDLLPCISHYCDHPLFGEALRRAAYHMIAMHDAAPRIVRYTANLQKWLLTQTIIALHFEHLVDSSQPELTAARLIEFMVNKSIASKNTAVAHLSEMRNYQLVVDGVRCSDKRARPLIVSALAETLIRQWFEGHLHSLDTLDQAGRLEISRGDPTLMSRVHPRAIRHLLTNPAWCNPPESVATFVWTESGSNILHDLIARTAATTPLEAPIWVGPLRLTEITNRYIISRSHAQRVFARARELGIVGWELPGNSGSFWISPKLINDYRAWQAVKFAALDEAFTWTSLQR
ncbi:MULTISPECIES: hypothetical protein [Shinella]|uniref:MarR family transcriptional regulator n=1 Tax=Shinella sedimenti TaxID=2919913 RepID=A0ABT0CTS0_9HYPH|nr:MULTISPECIES: hypothetical protein [Shinella]MCJ8152011.1 hypothetical protein [Shinella sedimenti]